MAASEINVISQNSHWRFNFSAFFARWPLIATDVANARGRFGKFIESHGVGLCINVGETPKNITVCSLLLGIPGK